MPTNNRLNDRFRSPSYIDVRAGGHLVFRIDPDRGVIQIKKGAEYIYVDLADVLATHTSTDNLTPTK